MGAVRLRVREVLRRRLASTLLLVALVGLAGGVVLAGVAGARRNDAALPGFLARQRPPDAMVFIATEAQGGAASADLGAEAEVIRSLPYVRTAHRVAAVLLATGEDDGRRVQLANQTLDPGGLPLWGEPILVDGRLPDERRADETAVDEELAARAGLRVGDRFPVTPYAADQLADVLTADAPRGSPEDLRVVGIVRHPHDLVPVDTSRDDVYSGRADLYLTPAFWARHGPDVATYGVGIAVRLDGGRQAVERLVEDVRDRFGFETFVERVDPEAGFVSIGLDGVRRAVDLESRAMQAFAVLAAVAGLGLVGQALARQLTAEAADHPSLRAVGMTGRELAAVALARTAVVAAAGAALATALAVALSPLTPIGLARKADPDGGISVDVPVLTLGALAIVLVVCAIAAFPAWRLGRTRGAPETSPDGYRLASALAGAGLRPTAVSGITLALRRSRGARAVPVGTAVAAAAFTVLAVVAAATFLTSLDRLVDDPPAYGVTWDVAVGNAAAAEEAEAVAAALAENPDVDAFTGFTIDVVEVNGRSETAVLLFDPGPVAPAVTEGRAPVGDAEVGLGGATLEALGVEVGDEVDLAISGLEGERFRVSGRMVLNSSGVDDSVTPGDGVVVSADGFHRLAPPEADPLWPQSYLVRLAPDADRETALAALEREFPRSVVPPLLPPEIDSVDRVSGLPVLLAALVAVLGLGATGHAMVSAVRRRRGELAVLKAVGFVRRQVSATVAWQATTFVVLALVLGLPLGVAAGRVAWRLTTDALHVVSPPRVPVGAVVVTAVVALVALNLVALVPGWLARRVSPATVLRTE